MTTVGPLHNQVPAPGPRDNNTIWYQDTTPKLYNELYFGVGPKAGVIVQHPNLGKVDLRGNTMANYYLEQSEGKYLPKGEVYPNWLQAAHSEGWYGADNESGSNHNIRAADLVQEVVDGINADDPDFPWQQLRRQRRRRGGQLHRHPRRPGPGGRRRPAGRLLHLVARLRTRLRRPGTSPARPAPTAPRATSTCVSTAWIPSTSTSA